MPGATRILATRIRRTLHGLLGGDLRISTPRPLPVQSLEVDGVRAECHWEWPTDPHFISEWDRLSRCSPAAAPFTSPTWQRDGIGPSLPPGSLRLIAAWRGPQLLALLPLELTPSGFLESAGRSVSDYLDPLTDGANDPATWRAILLLLGRLWDGRLKQVTLHHIRDDSPCRTILPSLAPESDLTCTPGPLDASACIPLPRSWDAYLDSLDPHERKEIRRKLRKAIDLANAHLRIHDHNSPDPSCLSTALDLIEAADPAKRDWLQQHLRPLLSRIGPQLLAEGRMRILFLMLNNRPAASLIDLPSPQGPLLYNSGFDPAVRQWSPGAVTFALAIQDAISRGASFFDLLRGREPYKYRLGALDEPLHQLRLCPAPR